MLFNIYKIFRCSLSELDITSKEALFEGDCLKSDIKGANDAKIDSVYIIREHNKNFKFDNINPKFKIY